MTRVVFMVVLYCILSSVSHADTLAQWASFPCPIQSITVRVTQAQEEAVKGQLSTTHQLEIRIPVDPTFSDVLHRREIGPLLVGHPKPPHLSHLLRCGPPDPSGSSSWLEHGPQPPLRPPRVP